MNPLELLKEIAGVEITEEITKVDDSSEKVEITLKFYANNSDFFMLGKEYPEHPYIHRIQNTCKKGRRDDVRMQFFVEIVGIGLINTLHYFSEKYTDLQEFDKE